MLNTLGQTIAMYIAIVCPNVFNIYYGLFKIF